MWTITLNKTNALLIEEQWQDVKNLIMGYKISMMREIREFCYKAQF